MITIIKYSKETIAKYWDNPNYRFFVLKMNANQELIVLSSNQTNNRIYQCHDPIGKSLYDFMTKEHADMWHGKYVTWKKQGVSCYIAKYDTESWETTVEIVDDTVFGSGRLITNQKLDLTSLEKYEFFNHYYIQPQAFTMITLNAESLIIEAIESTYAPDLSEYLGTHISSIISTCYNIFDVRTLQKSIQLNKIINFTEKVTYKGEIIYFDVLTIPYSHQSKLLILGKVISEQHYKKIQKNINNIYGIYPESNYFGVCEISYESKDNAHMIGCNQFFKSLLKDHDLSLQHILEHDAFLSCAEELCSKVGDLRYYNQAGTLMSFKLNVNNLSDLGENIFLVAVAPEDQYNDNINVLFSNLTKREHEVLSFVVDGHTNRFIANKLKIAEGTVKKIIYNGYKKLGISSRVELLKLIYELGVKSD